MYFIIYWQRHKLSLLFNAEGMAISAMIMKMIDDGNVDDDDLA